MPAQRYASVVDVHVILRRGGRILLLRRAGDTYASGQLCLPSGHVDEGESVLAGPGRLPPGAVGCTAAVITAVEHGLTFTLNGW